MKLIIRELQNVNSYREGRSVDVATLDDAKIDAEREQVYMGTILVIEDLDGNVLSVNDRVQWNDRDV